MLGSYLSEREEGFRPFAQYTPASALRLLRSLLSDLGEADCEKCRTHDFRRGHARDLQERGASLAEILRAGEWRSPAFLSYLDVHELERGAVVEAHLEESSDSESDDGSSSDTG